MKPSHMAACELKMQLRVCHTMAKKSVQVVSDIAAVAEGTTSSDKNSSNTV